MPPRLQPVCLTQCPEYSLAQGEGSHTPAHPQVSPVRGFSHPGPAASLAAPLHPQSAPVHGALGLGGGGLAFPLGGAGLKHHLRRQVGGGARAAPRFSSPLGIPQLYPLQVLLLVVPRVPCSLSCLQICSLFRTPLPYSPQGQQPAWSEAGGLPFFLPALPLTPAPLLPSLIPWLYRSGSGRFLEAG